MKNFAYCLKPANIVNPQLVGFILSSKKVYYNDSQYRWYEYKLPNFVLNDITKNVKLQLSNRLRKFLRHTPSITYFMNQDGVCIDAYMYVPCGHCILCIERKKKTFAAKCMMETQLHEFLPEFVTLTYDVQHLPKEGLKYRDIQLFLKRLRISLERNYGFTGELKYACGSEYGTHTLRPHYHMLIWGLPRQKGQPLWHNYNVDKLIRSCWQNGFVMVKTCRDSGAAYYVSKYMSKDVKIPLGCNAPIHRSSINLGVDFVMDKAAGVLRANPEFTDLSYCDRFTGKVCRIPMVKYFIDKVFPTYTSVPVEQRNALRDFHLSLDKSEFECHSNLPLLDTEVDVFRDTMYVYGKSINALDILKRTVNKVYPDFQANKAIRDIYYFHLFDNLGDIDLEHVAYKLTKKQAKDKDKEVF